MSTIIGEANHNTFFLRLKNLGLSIFDISIENTYSDKNKLILRLNIDDGYGEDVLEDVYRRVYKSITDGNLCRERDALLHFTEEEKRGLEKYKNYYDLEFLMRNNKDTDRLER